ncbi:MULTISPECIES: major capsid protein [Streptomyces]|uniref:major capsid protein n=1 Tax=Streptomyces TaxID=1883 RepID=UPI000D511353|nr:MULTISPECIES: major capsid protein [Streptomyces]PVC62967.1 phage capsid protein [Streptomyces sp. CS065A]
MQLITEYANPRDLSGYAREALRDREENTFTLSRWLPSDTIEDLEYRFETGGGGLTEAANYRAYDASSDIGTREGAARVSGQLPPISRKMPVSEYERIRRRAAATMHADIQDKIFGDTETLVNAIAARVELARGEAIFNSTVTLNENNVQAGVEFGRLAEHTTATGVNWTDTETSTIFDDLEAWRDLMLDNTGKVPRWALMPSRIARVMRSNAQLCRMSTTDYTAPSVLSLDELNALLFKHELPQVTTYDARVVFQGTAQRITPADKIALLPETGDELGKTLWGVPVEANDPRYGLAGGEQGGIYAGGYMNEDPQTVWTRATAIVLPVVGAPNLSLTAKVIGV